MRQFDIKIPVEPNGRLISELVRICNKYDSDILVAKNNIKRNVRAKSLIAWLSLSIHQYDKLSFVLLGRYEINDAIDLQDQLKFLFLKY